MVFTNDAGEEVFSAKAGEARALIEKPMLNGTDFREVPLRYLSKSSR